MNINALLQKTIVDDDILHKNNISILCLTETKLDPNDTLLSIPGYNLLRKDRQRGGGGVAILIRNDIVFKIIDVQGVETTDSKLEILTSNLSIYRL
jgi:exonuclease III